MTSKKMMYALVAIVAIIVVVASAGTYALINSGGGFCQVCIGWGFM